MHERERDPGGSWHPVVYLTCYVISPPLFQKIPFSSLTEFSTSCFKRNLKKKKLLADCDTFCHSKRRGYVNSFIKMQLKLRGMKVTRHCLSLYLKLFARGSEVERVNLDTSVKYICSRSLSQGQWPRGQALSHKATNGRSRLLLLTDALNGSWRLQTISLDLEADVFSSLWGGTQFLENI